MLPPSGRSDGCVWSSTVRFLLFLVSLLSLLSGCESCSSRSTPKPRSPVHSAIRPDITFQTYACPPAYAAWYCLNGATCFAVKIAESILYNCECADGYMGQRCEFKDPDGSYLPARKKLYLLQSPGFGLIFLCAFGLVILAAALGAALTKIRTRSKLKMLQKEVEVISICSNASGGGSLPPPSSCSPIPSGAGEPGGNSTDSFKWSHTPTPQSSTFHYFNQNHTIHHNHHLTIQSNHPNNYNIQRQTISYDISSRDPPSSSIPPPQQLQQSYYDEISRSSPSCHFLFNSSIVKC